MTGSDSPSRSSRPRARSAWWTASAPRWPATCAATTAAPSSRTQHTSRHWPKRSGTPTSFAVATDCGAFVPQAEAFLDALARRGEPLGAHVGRLAILLDRYGATELDAALAQALARGAVSASSVAHILDQRARKRSAPPPIDIVLPDDPRVRDLRVTPHALAPYDALSQHDDPEDSDEPAR